SMDIGAILALVISGCVFLYTIFRDNTKDTNDLLTRVATLETTIAVLESSISRIEDDQDKMRDTLSKLETQIHELDVKIERIIAILQQKQRP
ncbi:TPA: PspA/IM30 family protein, partial [Shigella sonnei]